MEDFKGCIGYIIIVGAFAVPVILAAEEGGGFFAGIGAFAVGGFILWALYKMFCDKN